MGQFGYYRVNYELSMWQDLIDLLMTNHEVSICRGCRLYCVLLATFVYAYGCRLLFILFQADGGVFNLSSGVFYGHICFGSIVVKAVY